MRWRSSSASAGSKAGGRLVEQQEARIELRARGRGRRGVPRRSSVRPRRDAPSRPSSVRRAWRARAACASRAAEPLRDVADLDVLADGQSAGTGAPPGRCARRRRGESRGGAGRVQSRSPTAIAPASGRWKPERTLTSVVLPAPFGPIRPSISPRASVRADVIDRDEAAEADGHTLAPEAAWLTRPVEEPVLLQRRELLHREAADAANLPLVDAMIAIGRVVWMWSSLV